MNKAAFNETESLGLLRDTGSGRETSEGFIRRQIGYLEGRLEKQRRLLEIILKASPLDDASDLAMWELLLHGPERGNNL